MTTPHLGLKQPVFGTDDLDGTGWTKDLNDNWDVVDQVLGGCWYNVKAYGAVGDGSTDDTTAIQDCFDAINETGDGRGMTVVFPPGKYACNGLVPPQGTLLLGIGAPVAYDGRYGASLVPTGNDAVCIDVPHAAEIRQGGLTLQNMSFSNGAHSYTNCIALRTAGVNRVYAYNCQVDHFARGFSLQNYPGYDSAWHYIHGCSFYRNTVGLWHDANGFQMFGCDFQIYQDTNIGIHMYADASVGAQTCLVMGTKFDDGIGILCQGGFNKIIGCGFETCVTGIKIEKPGGSPSYCGGRNVVQNTTHASNTTDIDIGSGCDNNGIIGYITSSPTNGIADAGTRTQVISSQGDRLPSRFPGGFAFKTLTYGPQDSDWTVAPPLGTAVIDTSAKRLYIRTGSNVWSYVALT